MKHNLSLIYRLGFLILSLWAILENAFFSVADLIFSFGELSVLVDTLCFFCIFVVFLFSIFGNVSSLFLRFKGVLTALSAFVLALNFSIWFMPGAANWVLGVLLPFLMLLDWLLFDKKGAFRLLDPLYWLLGLVLLYALWALLSGQFFSLSSLLSFFGGKDGLLSTLLTFLAAGALMYLLDRLCSGNKRATFWNLFAFLYRILFLLLTARALWENAWYSLKYMFFSLKDIHVLLCSLNFLCILLILIVALVKYRNLSFKSPFAKIKGALTVCSVLLLLYYHGLKGHSVSFYEILWSVSPAMMVLDFILFDIKRK